MKTTKNKIRVIFLDIDGVLNVIPPGYDKYGAMFHPPFIENLKHIIDETKAKIVISSSWRMSGKDFMLNMWADRNLPGEVIDVTPDGWWLYKKGFVTQDYDRGHEIEYWLRFHDVDNYVIIDDDTDMLESQAYNFVLTRANMNHEDCQDLGLGLTRKCAEQAIEILNKTK